MVGKLFITSSGGWSKAILVIVLYMLEMALRAGTDAWIGVWTSGQGDYPLWVYLTTYLALGIVFSIVCGVRAYALLRHSRGGKQHIIDLEVARLQLEPGSRTAEALDWAFSGSAQLG